MTDRGQAYAMLKDFLRARAHAQWTSNWFVHAAERLDLWQGPRRCIQRLGGMGADW